MCYRLRKNNGEIEKSKHFLSYNTNCIHNKKKWDNLKAIGKIIVYRKNKGITTITYNYYILGPKIPIDMFEEATRNNWNIET